MFQARNKLVQNAPALPVEFSPFNPLGDHINETLGGSVFSPADVPDRSRYIFIQAIDENIRYTLDGSAPSATNGFQQAAGNPPLLIPIAPRTTVQFFREAAGAILQAQFGE